MEQLEFDCRLESERELEENVKHRPGICLQTGQGNQQVEGYRTATTDTVSLQNSTQA